MRPYIPLIVFFLGLGTLMVSAKLRREKVAVNDRKEFAVPAPVKPYAKNSGKSLSSRKDLKRLEFRLAKSQTRKRGLYERSTPPDRSISSVK